MTRAKSREILRDLLALVGCYPPHVEITQWSVAEAALAERWAAREHLAASDNPVERLEVPYFLATYIARPGEAESDVRRRTRAISTRRPRVA